MVALGVCCLTVLSFQTVCAEVNGAPQSRPDLPNVIVVMADDLGLGDVSPTTPQPKPQNIVEGPTFKG